MSKKQVSVKGVTYRRVREYCTQRNIAISAFVDALCTDFFDQKDKGRYDRQIVDFRSVLF